TYCYWYIEEIPLIIKNAIDVKDTKRTPKRFE
ncbi:hypothetical protein WwAna0417, partial [Wolbachia endosymbiont of Drosophila ananassae]